MQEYDYTIQHIKGSDNPADILSRQPLKYHKEVSTEEQLAEGFINHIVANSVPKALSLRAIEEALRTNDWTNKMTEPYKYVKNELSTKCGVVVSGSRMVIPTKLRKHTLQLAHETHLGMVKTKALLRAKVWWPNIDKDVEETIKWCIPCASLDPRKQANPVNMTTMKGPWEVIHIDICGPFPSGDYIIGIIDAGSRWPEVFVVKSTSTNIVTSILEKCLCTHGVPTVIVSDNGPQFRAREFNQFCNKWGIQHHKVYTLSPPS
ncbi:hypothetical protein Pmani_001374 [Petrolisthes manimaculis]|uniref:RNA-directed DNA polymerase n=1 Tax=Petrolisthes manimaculis TaxID=1843537 RepID=A0AAE1QKT0_9EUCA|nr:hypothetical protein Pmani_001374 [Petrolisthes manimaculis]